MKALINNETQDTITENRWLDWFGPNGERLIARMAGYRLAEGELNEDGEFIEGSQPAAEQDREAERIAELEAELKRLKGGRA